MVFVSSCETVEFLHTLFTSVLGGTNQTPGICFLRLHGNMKQEASPCEEGFWAGLGVASAYMSVFQERTDVFQTFSGCGCGVLLCTVSVGVTAAAGRRRHRRSLLSLCSRMWRLEGWTCPRSPGLCRWVQMFLVQTWQLLIDTWPCFSSRPRQRRQSTCTAPGERRGWERRAAASCSSRRRRPPSSTN